MTGRFIISLDCEGKWGMADVLQDYHHRLFTDEALAAVYADLVALFGAYDTPATFAFVMAFTLSQDERKEFAALLEDSGRKDDWLTHHWDERRAGRTGGWFQPEALEIVRADPRHEIACHSFCHRDLADGAISEAGAEAELAAAAAVAALKGVDLRTFVYPRNSIGHLAALRRAGYVGYRTARGSRGRILAIASEFNLRPAPEEAVSPRADGLIAIPAGYFLNWRFGPRRYVPQAVTVRRWTNLLDSAAASGGVAHLWFHPHNLITGPSTRDALEQILAYAARLREEGRLQIVTQERYCEDLAGRRRPVGSSTEQLRDS